jgi:hypothetical protein
MSFYGSTPAYKIFLDHHGWGDLQPELNRLSKEGKWLDMTRLITDEMVDVVGVSGTPDQVAKRIRERNAFARRTTMVVYNEAGPDALQEVVRKLRG